MQRLVAGRLVVDTSWPGGLAEGLLRLQLTAGLVVSGAPVLEALRSQTGPSGGQEAFVLIPTPVPAALLALAPTVLTYLNARLQSLPQVQPLQRLVDALARHVPPGTNKRHFMREAVALGLPVLPLPGGVFQFGWGRRSRLFNSSITDGTSAVSTAWAKDKRATHELLRLGGLPVPDQAPVGSLDSALEAARRIGYPVVLKPAALDQGLGVEAGLRDEADLRAAYPRSLRHASALVLEKHVPGEDYRVYVVQGEVVAVAHRIPARVVGDGVATVDELLDGVNVQRRQAGSASSVYKPLVLDEEALDLLARQGLEPGAVPAAGQVVRLCRSANSSRGGSSTDVTPQLHPDNAALCVRAAALLRLDIAGLDLLMPDIARSWREVGAAFCEVNAQPQMGGAHPWIFRHILQRFVTGRGRIPSVLVLGEAAEQGLAEVIASALEAGGRSTRVVRGPAERLLALGRAALIDPGTGAVVLYADATGLERWGLPVDRFDVLVLGGRLVPQPALLRTLQLLAPQLAGVACLEAGWAADPALGRACHERLLRLLGPQRVRVIQGPAALATAVCDELESLPDGG